jgi:hypothetical protein
MMDNFIEWYRKNILQISWFIIGWMTLQGIDALVHGQYLDSAVAFFLVGLNFAMSNR